MSDVLIFSIPFSSRTESLTYTNLHEYLPLSSRQNYRYKNYSSRCGVEIIESKYFIYKSSLIQYKFLITPRDFFIGISPEILHGDLPSLLRREEIEPESPVLSRRVQRKKILGILHRTCEEILVNMTRKKSHTRTRTILVFCLTAGSRWKTARPRSNRRSSSRETAAPRAHHPIVPLQRSL